MDRQSKNLFPNTHKRTNNLLSGEHLIELVEIKEGAPRRFDRDKEPRPCIVFKFRTDSGEPVIRTVTATTDARGRCVELVRQMAGANQPTERDLESGESLTQFILGLVGKKFQATLEPSSNGRYNNIVSIRQAGGR